MKNEPLLQICLTSATFREAFMLKQHHPTPKSSLFMDSFQTRTSGKVRMDIYQVFPSIHLSLNLFLADQVSFATTPTSISWKSLTVTWGASAGISIAGLLFLSGKWRPLPSEYRLLCRFRYGVSSWILRGNQYFYSFKKSLGPSSTCT